MILLRIFQLAFVLFVMGAVVALGAPLFLPAAVGLRIGYGGLCVMFSGLVGLAVMACLSLFDE